MVRAKRQGCAALAAGLAAISARFALAGDLQWDPSDVAGVQGGAGTWNTALANWHNGTANVQWSNNPNDVAILGATPGAQITLGRSITARAIIAEIPGYIIASASNHPLTVASGSITAHGDLTITTTLSQSAGLSKLGAGTLLLTVNNSVTGPINLIGGTLAYSADAHLGATANDIVFSGGKLRYDGAATIVIPAGRQIIVNGEGGAIAVSNGGLIIAGNNQIIGTGTLKHLGPQLLRFNGPNASFAGSFEVAGGVLSIENAQATNGRPVVVSGGALWLRGDEGLDFAGDVSVTGTATVQVDQFNFSAQGAAHRIGAFTVTGSGNATYTAFDKRHLIADSLHVDGVLKLTAEMTANGAPLGSGTIRLSAAYFAVNYDGPSPMGEILAAIAGERIVADDGALAVAAVESAELFGLSAGQTAKANLMTVDETAVLLRAARAGDANFDGAVDFSDFQRLEVAFGNAGSWIEGDFDASGFVDGADFLLLHANFAASGAADAAALEAFAAAHNVPEPGAIAVMGLAALLRRRRGRG